jgi:hypothetical protein
MWSQYQVILENTAAHTRITDTSQNISVGQVLSTRSSRATHGPWHGVALPAAVNRIL